MSCEIKNEKCPFQIQCLFPTAANDTRPFGLYFHPSQGTQERVIFCAYKGNYKCYGDQGFKETHNGFNNVTITVLDTSVSREGFFRCQKGEICLVKTCSYQPPQICDDIRSTKSGNGLGTTTKGNSPAIAVSAIVAPIVIGLIIIIIIIGGLLYRYCERFQKRRRYIDVPSDVTSGEPEKVSLGKENTGNHVKQSRIDRLRDSWMEFIMGWINLINRDNADNQQTANVGQRHPSTGNRTSGALSEIQPTLPSSGNSTPSPGSVGSDKPLIWP